MINYEFKHPNHGWQGIQAPCDARNFAILMDWEVQSHLPYKDPGDCKLFNLVMHSYDKTLLEVVSSPELHLDDMEIYVRLTRPGQEDVQIELISILSPLDVQIVQTCPSSDPAGISMPLSVKAGNIWMLPIPEEVFKLKGVYARLFIPKELVR